MPRDRWTALLLTAALVCAAPPARAETWKSVVETPIRGIEGCIDSDSLRTGADGKSEFRFKMCGARAEVAYAYRVDCKQDYSKWDQPTDDKSKWAVMDGDEGKGLREMRVANDSMLAEAAKWVCEHRPSGAR